MRDRREGNCVADHELTGLCDNQLAIARFVTPAATDNRKHTGTQNHLLSKGAPTAGKITLYALEPKTIIIDFAVWNGAWQKSAQFFVGLGTPTSDRDEAIARKTKRRHLATPSRSRIPGPE